MLSLEQTSPDLHTLHEEHHCKHDGNIQHNLVWHFRTFLISFVYTNGVRHLFDGRSTFITRNRGTHWNFHILRTLYRHFLAHLLGEDFTLWRITSSCGSLSPTMISIFIRYCSMAHLLMDWMTLRFIGGLIAVLSFCGTLLLIHLMTLLISYRPGSGSAILFGEMLTFLFVLCLVLMLGLQVALL